MNNIVHRAKWLGIGLVLFMTAGCGTTTQRLATDQLLISEAVDSAISQIDFRPLTDRSVYLDTTYLKQVKGVGFVNADYIISSLRQQLASARCLLQEDRSKAEVIVEPRVGALGTDGHEITYGIPQTSAISSAATAISSSPLPPIPELSIGRSNAHSGIAKIVVFAYDRESRQPVWQSGITKAESSSKNTWLLGAGPFQRGSIHEGVQFAGTYLRSDPKYDRDPNQPEWVGYANEHVFNESRSDKPQLNMPSNRTADAQGDQAEVKK